MQFTTIPRSVSSKALDDASGRKPVSCRICCLEYLLQIEVPSVVIIAHVYVSVYMGG